MRKGWLLFLAGWALVLGGAALASAIQTTGGIKVHDIRFRIQHGLKASQVQAARTVVTPAKTRNERGGQPEKSQPNTSTDVDLVLPEWTARKDAAVEERGELVVGRQRLEQRLADIGVSELPLHHPFAVFSRRSGNGSLRVRDD